MASHCKAGHEWLPWVEMPEWIVATHEATRPEGSDGGWIRICKHEHINGAGSCGWMQTWCNPGDPNHPDYDTVR